MRLHMHMHRCTCIHALYYACIMHACMPQPRTPHLHLPPLSLPADNASSPREMVRPPLTIRKGHLDTTDGEPIPSSPGLRWQAVGLLGNLGKSQKRYDQL